MVVGQLWEVCFVVGWRVDLIEGRTGGDTKLQTTERERVEGHQSSIVLPLLLFHRWYNFYVITNISCVVFLRDVI